MSITKFSRDARVRVLTHGEDVDGLVCASIALKRFPNAVIETGSPRSDLCGEYDLVVDLPLKKSVRTKVWIDHHKNTVQDGHADEKIYDPNSKSAASLLSRYLGIPADLAEIADRADSVSYLTKPPTKMNGEYDIAWDLNDAVKAVQNSKRFVELARLLAARGTERVKSEFREEIAYTRRLREKAEKIVTIVSEKMKTAGANAVVVIMPSGELNSPTVSGHVVFSLYERGAKVCAIFYEGGCWFNVRKDFDGVDASEVMKKFGGGGHRKSAGAPIAPENVGRVVEEIKRANLNPLLIDMRHRTKD